jgi:hypothetical protein
MNHLILRNSANNKDVRVHLGDNAAATNFQVRNSSNTKVAEIDSLGGADFTSIKSKGTSYLSGALRKHYVYSAGSSNYNLTGSDHVVVFNKSGHVTASLPNVNIDLNGIVYVLKNISSNEVFITGAADTEQFIDGQQSKTLTQGDSIELMTYYGNSGYEWGILSYYNV